MKRILRTGALLAIIALVLSVSISSTLAALTVGSRGNDVKTAQKKLINWGYMSGSADGIYGEKTKQAVMAFQKKNGINQSGTIDDATAKALGLSSSSSSSSSDGGNKKDDSGYKPSSGKNDGSDLNLLARCIYGEGRGEPYKGKVAIGAIVLNRVKHAEFPNSISGVIYQPGAFSIVADGQINLTPDEECIKAAKDAMNGYDPSNGCIFYFNPKKTSNKYMHSKTPVITIGEHVFTM